MSSIRLCVGAALFLLAAAAPGLAAEDPEICRAESGDTAIEACNRVINSGKHPQGVVATAYVNRGQEWYIKKENDKALADFTAAIKLNKGPDIALAFGNRANVLRRKDQKEAAIADYSKAIGMVKDYTAAYVGRGLCYEDTGRKDLAIADYKKALAMQARFDDGKWAHETARRRLEQLKSD